MIPRKYTEGCSASLSFQWRCTVGVEAQLLSQPRRDKRRARARRVPIAARGALWRLVSATGTCRAPRRAASASAALDLVLNRTILSVMLVLQGTNIYLPFPARPAQSSRPA